MTDTQATVPLARCEMCAFFRAATDGGECRRHAPPPTIIQTSLAVAADESDVTKFRGLWPLVAKADWCGDYQKAP